MIELKHLRKTFRTSDMEIVALDDINLTINDGEIFGIIGLSGAGKSTLVRCINLLETPTSGEVVIDGKSLTTLPRGELLKLRQSIGMIFQGFNLLEQRNLLKNVCYPMEIAGVAPRAAKKRAQELLERVGLGDRANSYPAQLSGGQKQRVAIARALACDPKYILCDEATSALDPNTTRSILELLRQINRELGVTIIVITHEMKVIEQICDRVAVIDSSHIAEIGKVSDVFSDPQTEIAKELIVPSQQKAKRAGNAGARKIRLTFGGESAGSSGDPILSRLILETQVPVSILFADTEEVGGNIRGHMIIELPQDEEKVARVIEWLDRNYSDWKEEK